jgi:hypothetical protein
MQFALHILCRRPPSFLQCHAERHISPNDLGRAAHGQWKPVLRGLRWHDAASEVPVAVGIGEMETTASVSSVRRERNDCMRAIAIRSTHDKMPLELLRMPHPELDSGVVFPF